MSEFGVDIKGLEQDMLNYKPQLSLPYKKLHPDAVTPFYNYPTDSGFDLHSVNEITIPAFGRALVPTGLAFDIETGHEIQVRTKSGLAINQGLMVLNSPGTVDCGYTGEVKAIIFNTNPHEFTITKGMKVAQGVYCPVANGEWVNLNEVKTIKEKDRKANGFGSTGI
jgi:dUTP pyrophosphatase